MNETVVHLSRQKVSSTAIQSEGQFPEHCAGLDREISWQTSSDDRQYVFPPEVLLGRHDKYLSEKAPCVLSIRSENDLELVIWTVVPILGEDHLHIGGEETNLFTLDCEINRSRNYNRSFLNANVLIGEVLHGNLEACG